MLHRSQTALLVVPAVLAGALLLALAPACTMPGCGPLMGLAGMMHHGCQDYMMVDDTPDGLVAPQAPAVAVVAVAALPVEVSTPTLGDPLIEMPLSPEFDPLGVRIRI